MIRHARLLLGATCALALVGLLSCSTSSNQPPDPSGPGAGGGGFGQPPRLTSVTPLETCATAGNLVTLIGPNLVDPAFLASVTINNVPADIVQRIDGGTFGDDQLVIQTRQQPGQIQQGGLLVNVVVTTPNGTSQLTGGLRLLPACQGPPVLVSISPNTGSRAGGSAITLVGDNLACVTSVRFVGTRGAGTLNVDINAVASDQEIMFDGPITSSLSSEPYDVVVTSACGTSVLPGAFQFSGTGTGGGTVVPDATSIVDVTTNLPQGPATGGNQVRITGRDLNLVDSITIGSVTITSGFFVTALGDIIIPAMPASPGGAGLTLPLSVTVKDGTNADTSPLIYTYLGAGAPNCVTLSPNSGTTAGGTAVTITGSNLNDVTQVLFGRKPATQLFYPDAVNGQRLVAISPAFDVPIDVDVELQIGGPPGAFTTVDTCRPARFTYVDPMPTNQFAVTCLSPTFGPQTGGTSIIISGTGLSVVNSVRICNVAATIVGTPNDTQVIALTGPFGGVVPSTCDIVVSTSTGLAVTLPPTFDPVPPSTCMGPGRFTYNAVVPDAQSYDAASARTAPACGGTTFRLQGINFIGASGVRFSGTQAQSSAEACDVDIQSNTAISGTVPAYITTSGPFPADVNVVVESGAGGDSTPLLFRYYDNPTLTSAFAPGGTDVVSSGDLVTLRGLNFRPESDTFVASVKLSNSGLIAGTMAGTDMGFVQFVVVDNNTIQFAFPPTLLTQDRYDVTISTPNTGHSCTAGTCSFTLVGALFHGSSPVPTRVQPDKGRYSGGTTIVISGNFSLPVTGVSICGVNQGPPTAQTISTITLQTRGVAEASAGTPCDVIVTNAAGSDVIVGGYTFIADPDLATAEVTTANCGTLVYPASSPIPVSAGSSLTIRGTDLAGITNVTIGGQVAVISPGQTDTALTVTVPIAPAMGGPRFEVVTQVVFAPPPTGAGTADAPFTDTLALAVRYLAPPTITSLTPANVAAGQIATIAGTGLRNADGSNPIVTFGGSNAIVVGATDTALQVIVPASTPGQTVLVSVSTCAGDGTTSFTYPCNVPAITSIAPTVGQAGDIVTLTGTDLVGPSGTPPTVTFGATTGTVLTSTPTTVTVTVPAGTIGTSAVVTLVTCGGSATAPQPFRYQCTPPSISSVAPQFGAQGTTVTITGVDLNSPDGSGVTVRFGGGNGSTPIVNATGTSLTSMAPAGFGTVDVTVITCGGSATSPGAFTYCPLPAPTSLAPTSGPAGQVVTITGSNLQDPSGTPPTVTFTAGSSVAAVVVGSAPGSVQVQAPAGLSGLATVTITTCGGGPVSAGTFRYCTAPVITSIAPVVGGAGTQVTVIGTDLFGSDGVPGTFRFGGVPASSVLQATPTRFVITAPPGLVGPVAVDVTTCGGTTQAPQLFAYCQTPTVTGLVPSNGPAGTEVTISGTNLIGADGNTGVVTFGTTPATVVTRSATSLVVVAPAGFPSNTGVNVRVATCGGTSATSAASVFTYQTATTCVAPVITSIVPSAGATGSQVTITGTNLVGNDGMVGTVKFGAANATVIAGTPTQIVVQVPAGAGSVAVTVTTCGGSASAPQVFRYCTPPTITGIAPSSGPAGTSVVITGTNLQGADGVATTVQFGATPATVVDSTATTVTVTSPMGIAPGTSVNVRATTCGGTATSPTPYTYVSTTTFDVTSIAPTSGPRSGNQLISISGTGFAIPGAMVNGISICNVPATNVVVVSDNQVTARTGQFNGAVPSNCDVVVSTQNGQTDTLVSGYMYLPAVPDGTVFDPAGAFTAPAAGGTSFKIDGMNLLGVTSVSFGGLVNSPNACNVQALSDTMVSGTVPAYITPGGPFPASVQVFPMSAAGTDPTTVTAPTPSMLFTYYPNPRVTSAAPAFIPPGTLPRVITLTGTNFMDPSNRDVFLAPHVTVTNAGLAHPTTFPAGAYTNPNIGLNVLNSTTANFVMPVPPKGDSYDVTVFTFPDCGATTYSFTLGSAFTVNSEFDCTDTLDNDADGLADCLDADCEAVAPCP